MSADNVTPPATVPTPAPSPFDHPLADVVIRSSDYVEFRMFKIDLSRSSPVFESMFTLPQPSSTGESDDRREGLPVVPVTETADVLNIFLPFCTIAPTPALETPEDVFGVMKTARKYDAPLAVAAAERALMALAERLPLRAYALACFFDAEDTARKAALFCLRSSLQDLVGESFPELKLIDGDAHRRLVDYRLRCWTATSGVLSRWSSDIADRDTTWQCRFCWTLSKGKYCYEVAPWWDRFMSVLRSTLESNTWEGVVDHGDLFPWFAAMPCTNASSGCSHTSIEAHAKSHLERMRNAIFGAISEVRLDFQLGSALTQASD